MSAREKLSIQIQRFLSLCTPLNVRKEGSEICRRPNLYRARFVTVRFTRKAQHLSSPIFFSQVAVTQVRWVTHGWLDYATWTFQPTGGDELCALHWQSSQIGERKREAVKHHTAAFRCLWRNKAARQCSITFEPIICMIRHLETIHVS
jgi:hypothetical protein